MAKDKSGPRLVKGKTAKAGEKPPDAPAGPPALEAPALFPADAASILQRAKISKRQFSKYSEQLVLFMMTHCSADFVVSLQSLIRSGDKAGMELFAKMMNLIKSESGVTVNFQQNMQIGTGSDRRVDGLIRMLDARDREPHRMLPMGEVRDVEVCPDLDK